MTRWRPALRMARRDLWAHKSRSLLMMCLVALPVLVAVTVAQFHHNLQWDGERAARAAMGGADLLVEVTPYDEVTLNYWPGDLGWTPLDRTGEPLAGERMPKAQRDASDVDLAALLPEGSRVIGGRLYGEVSLDTGGTGAVTIIDASDPMSEGLGQVSEGSAPTGPLDVALSQANARALDLLDEGGAPRADATLSLIDGTVMRVVGVIDPRDAQTFADGIEMLAAPGSRVAREALGAEPAEAASTDRFLVDLPDTSYATVRELVDALAAEGVAALPRDAVLHPTQWNVQDATSGPVDVAALAVGALVVGGVGLASLTGLEHPGSCR